MPERCDGGRPDRKSIWTGPGIWTAPGSGGRRAGHSGDPNSNTGLIGGVASRWWALGWVIPMVVQLVHTAAVAPTYHVGSFDDDANYLMAAHVLAAGGGLTSIMPSGATVVANYLPGYPVLLVPLIWLWGSALWAPRAFSSLCVAVLYPLLWAWMDRRGVKPSYRVAVLGLLAINTVMATFSTMVMAEAPFLLVLVLTLFALDRWERRPGLLQGAIVVVLLGSLVWLKEAGIGLVVGVVAYELWRRRWPRAVGVGAGVGALLLPGLVARWVTGGATVGDRYVGEIGGRGNGGFLRQLPGEVVGDIWSYLDNVLRQSVLPAGSPLPAHGPVPVLMAMVGATVPVFCIVGAVVWYRRHPMADSWMIWAYFVETLAYPYNNQRRVILVLPVVTIWYVVGAAAVARYALALGGHALSRVAASVAVVMAVLVAGVPTAAGFTRDYLFNVGQKSYQFAQSPAMDLLKAIGPPTAVVETDYQGSVAFFSDHRTAWTAFVMTTPYGPFAVNSSSCSVDVVKSALLGDGADFLMLGDVNYPGVMDSPCLLHLASDAATGKSIGAERILSTVNNETSLFELVGPGSSQPNLVDWTAGQRPRTAPDWSSRAGTNRAGTNRTGPNRTGPTRDLAGTRLSHARRSHAHRPGTERPAAAEVVLSPNGEGDAGGIGYQAAAHHGRAAFYWSWSKPVAVTQLSIGSITSTAPVRSASVLIKRPDGEWHTVVSVAGPVGDEGVVPYLLQQLPAGTTALGLKVRVDTSGTAQVDYVNAIGASRAPGPVPAASPAG